MINVDIFLNALMRQTLYVLSNVLNDDRAMVFSMPY